MPLGPTEEKAECNSMECQEHPASSIIQEPQEILWKSLWKSFGNLEDLNKSEQNHLSSLGKSWIIMRTDSHSVFFCNDVIIFWFCACFVLQTFISTLRSRTLRVGRMDCQGLGSCISSVSSYLDIPIYYFKHIFSDFFTYLKCQLFYWRGMECLPCDLWWCHSHTLQSQEVRSGSAWENMLNAMASYAHE